MAVIYLSTYFYHTVASRCIHTERVTIPVVGELSLTYIGEFWPSELWENKLNWAKQNVITE